MCRQAASIERPLEQRPHDSQPECACAEFQPRRTFAPPCDKHTTALRTRSTTWTCYKCDECMHAHLAHVAL